MRRRALHRKWLVLCVAALLAWSGVPGVWYARAEDAPEEAPAAEAQAAESAPDSEAAQSPEEPASKAEEPPKSEEPAAESAPGESSPEPDPKSDNSETEEIEAEKPGAAQASEEAPAKKDATAETSEIPEETSETAEAPTEPASEAAVPIGPAPPTAADIGPLEIEAAPPQVAPIEQAPADQAPSSKDRADLDEYFARIVDVRDFVRVADRDRGGYANYNTPRRLEGDYHIQTPKTGGATLAFPSGVSVRMDPDSALSWLDEEITLREGFFDIEIPTLYYLKLGKDEGAESARGARRVQKVLRTLEQCEEFVQATRRTRFQILLKPGKEPEIAVLKGDLRRGRELLLPPRLVASLEGLPLDLRPPMPMIPFGGHTFYLPLDELAFVVDSPAGRAWVFEFSTDPDFSEIFCRVRSPKNSVRIPPLGQGFYFWRVGRINVDGIRTLFSDPSDFEIQ